jgi:ABC-type sugar transport system ATPase subunit
VKLLILDEPTAALNDEDSAHLLDLLRGLRDEGITCVIISHKLNEIAAIADSITILRDGRLVEALDFAVDEVTEDRIIAAMVGRDLEHRFPPHTPLRDILSPSRTGPSSIRSTSSARWSTACRSTSGAARSSASPA